MYSHLRLAQKYLHYYLTASNGKGHGIHSPFVFDLVRKVLMDDSHFPDYAPIENLRHQLQRDRTLLEIEDLGAGSAIKAARQRNMEDIARQRSIADIARQAAKPRKLGQLLFRIARYYQPGTILELGTSLGLSTAYLAAGAPDASVWTIEGAEAVAAVARRNFHSLGLKKVNEVTGNFDQVLVTVLDKAGPVDLAFVDGNHRLEPTLRYFESLIGRASRCSLLIFDDIHWSEEMEAAWASIKKDARVYLTVDLFFIGLVFLREEFKVKQEFVIRF
jgi:predicted O-methyltransferase YrrM